MRDAWSGIMDAMHAARLGRLAVTGSNAKYGRNTMDYMVIIRFIFS